jgi:hypothetical protein
MRPTALTLNIELMLSLVSVSIGETEYGAAPALFMRIFILPYAFLVSVKVWPISSDFATLPPMTTALPPVFVIPATILLEYFFSHSGVSLGKLYEPLIASTFQSNIVGGQSFMTNSKSTPSGLLDSTRKELKSLLRGGHSHAKLEKVVKDFPKELRGTVPDGLPYSAWQDLEHMHIDQRYMLKL